MARAKATFASRGLKVPPSVIEGAREWDRSDWRSTGETARHEAAHAVACIEFGGKLDRAIVNGGGAGGGGYCYGRWPVGETERAIVLLAGEAAVARSRGEVLKVSNGELRRHISTAANTADVSCDICKTCLTLIRNRPAATDGSVIAAFRHYEQQANAFVARADIWRRVQNIGRELWRRQGQYVSAERIAALEDAQTSRKLDLPHSLRAADLAPGTYRKGDNSVEVTWTTGAIVRRIGIDGPYDEELIVDKKSVRLDRLNAGAPFLNTHQDYTLSNVIGSVIPGTAKIANGIGMARVRLSSAPGDADVVQKIIDGIIRNVSVGYAIHRVEVRQSGDVPLWRVVDWEPFEISAVPVPADAGATIRRRQIEATECTIIDRAAWPSRAAQRQRMRQRMEAIGV